MDVLKVLSIHLGERNFRYYLGSCLVTVGTDGDRSIPFAIALENREKVRFLTTLLFLSSVIIVAVVSAKRLLSSVTLKALC